MTQPSNNAFRFELACPLVSGLHARPASHLAEVANQFEAECTITNLRNGLPANGKSVLGIIAADIRHGDRFTVHVSGRDERAAYDTLRRFIEQSLPHSDVPLAGVTHTTGELKPPRVLLAANVNFVIGRPVSRGIGQGKVVVLRRMNLPVDLKSNEPNSSTATDTLRELDRVEDALFAVRRRISEKLQHTLTPAGTAILQADLAMAGDVFLVEKLKEHILRGKSAAQAVAETGEFFVNLLGHSESEYIRERSADIEEICVQLLEEIQGPGAVTASIELHEPSVLVAENLAPQQILGMNHHHLKALVLEHSGATSHAVILARSLGIPTLAGVRNARTLLLPGVEVLVDADRGFAVPKISPEVARFYQRERKTLNDRKQLWSRNAQPAALTSDGRQVEVAANASAGDEIALAFENAADGIGLFRTEMIFLGRDAAPSEEEQFAIYSEAARRAAGRPVIIRTFDIGGDKKAPYLNLPAEENPFLGYRGVRIYTEHRELLLSQLRAILRASTAGQIQIMAPMIASIEEVLQFKSAVAEAKQQLAQAGIAFQPNLKVGIMVEVPAAAFILNQLAPEVDFFSIGTNDLSQYFLAADRGNSKIAPQFTVRHPGFLRFLQQLVEQIHQAGKWVGMCGEMAADVRNLPLLLGLGLDEISVPAAEVPEFKRAIAGLNSGDSAAILRRAISSSTTTEVNELLTIGRPYQAEPLLSEDLVLLGSTSQSKEEVIQEMIDAFYICNRADDRQALEEALWARESVYSTGLGFGFATPHCKTDAVNADSICVLRLTDPVNWGSVDGELVRMVVLLAMRNSENANTHMQVFSTLARKLMSGTFRQQLSRCETPSDVTAYLAAELGISPGRPLERPLSHQQPEQQPMP